MKKIITLSMIKNEADIIETFVRYTMGFAYKMVIIDNGSTDGTVEIIKALKEEGFKIDLYIEANVFYEQLLIENKYFKLIEKTESCDFIIPLDADEFVYPVANSFDVFDKLPTNSVSILKWRTYCLDSNKPVENIFSDIVLRRSNANELSKVIIPFGLANKVFLTMGHHWIESQEDIEKNNIYDIVIAHFPVRSVSQIKLKLYQGFISQLMSSYHSMVVFHWRDMFQKLQDGKFDIVNYSKTYALKEDDKPSYENDPINIDWYKADLKCKYMLKIKRNLEDIIFSIAEMMALRNIVVGKSALKKLIIYGTGRTAKDLSMFRQYKPSNYELIAYVDSDKNKEYSTFNGKLVIAPDKLKYIDFDVIVIASVYKDEIYQTLCDECVDRKKIISSLDIMQEEIDGFLS